LQYFGKILQFLIKRIAKEVQKKWRIPSTAEKWRDRTLNAADLWFGGFRGLLHYFYENLPNEAAFTTWYKSVS